MISKLFSLFLSIINNTDVCSIAISKKKMSVVAPSFVLILVYIQMGDKFYLIQSVVTFAFLVLLHIYPTMKLFDPITIGWTTQKNSKLY